MFSDVDPKMRIAQEEIFGPVVSVIPCDNLEHAIEIANGVAYGLSSAIYTKDVNRAFLAMQRAERGHYLRECTHDWGRGASAVWRGKSHGKRASRRRNRRF